MLQYYESHLVFTPNEEDGANGANGANGGATNGAL